MLIQLAVVLVASRLRCPQAIEPKGPPTIIVQVVDPAWIPVPGARVETVQEARSDGKGSTQFWLGGDAEYDIEVSSPGFRKARVRAVRVTRAPPSSAFPTAHVQIRLKLAGPTVTVH